MTAVQLQACLLDRPGFAGKECDFFRRCGNGFECDRASSLCVPEEEGPPDAGGNPREDGGVAPADMKLPGDPLPVSDETASTDAAQAADEVVWPDELVVDEDLDGYSPPEDCDDTDPLVHPGAEEVCNNLKDDDCDGSTDVAEGCSCSEGETLPCGTDVGECKAGTVHCAGDGTWGPCEGAKAGSDETCNGLDDDCDSAIDESFSCAFGTFAECVIAGQDKGIQACRSDCSGWDRCYPNPEDCNGEDDDDDGLTDETYTCAKDKEYFCTVNGLPGAKKCSADCSTLGPCKAPEACNGLDDDADGRTDNGFACVKNSQEPCEVSSVQGTKACLSDCSGYGPCRIPEVCNGLDDDIDGRTDEDLEPDACGYTCRHNAEDKTPGDLGILFDASLFGKPGNAPNGKCCGDDASEFALKSAPPGSPSEVAACCLHGTDCVGGAGACHPAAAPLPSNGAFICDSGAWRECNRGSQNAAVGSYICTCDEVGGEEPGGLVCAWTARS